MHTRSYTPQPAHNKTDAWRFNMIKAEKRLFFKSHLVPQTDFGSFNFSEQRARMFLMFI